MKTLRLVAKYALWLLNIAVVVLLLCSLAIPRISAHQFWPLGILGLGVPFIALANLIFIVIWLLLGKYRRMLLSVVAIIACWKVFSVACAGNMFEENKMRYASNTLKVMSYNVRLFNLYGTHNNASTRKNVAEFINEHKPDIICFQEFFDGTVIPKTDNVAFFKETCGYEHVAYSTNIESRRGKFGDVIFSKHPIVNSASIDLATDGNKHNYQYADVVKGSDTFRVFNLHLQSISLSENEVSLIDDAELSKLKKDNLSRGVSILKKLKNSFQLRSTQAEQIAKSIKASKFPAIACGDFNDLPTSYTYFKIREDLCDAFLDKGFGLGKTYTAVSSILRIDYILHDVKRLETTGFLLKRLSYSDHFPLIANFEVRQPK